MDSGVGEISPDQYDELLAVLDGRPIGSDAAAKKPVLATGHKTPNGNNYSDGIVASPGGQFEMGSINGDSDERTSRGQTVTVTMSGFSISKSEVTVGQYKAYLAATGDPLFSKLPDFEENKKGDRFPVVGLTYDEIMAFCKHYGGTLPTAA